MTSITRHESSASGKGSAILHQQMLSGAVADLYTCLLKERVAVWLMACGRLVEHAGCWGLSYTAAVQT